MERNRIFGHPICGPAWPITLWVVFLLDRGQLHSSGANLAIGLPDYTTRKFVFSWFDVVAGLDEELFEKSIGEENHNLRQLEGNSLATAPIPNSLDGALLWHFNKARAPLCFPYRVEQNWELFREYYRRFVMISLWSGNFVHCRVFSSSLGHSKCGET